MYRLLGYSTILRSSHTLYLCVRCVADIVTAFLKLRHIGDRTDTTQQSGQTPDKEVEIKNITVYVSGYTETDTTEMLSPSTVWSFSVAADINSNVFDFYFLIWSLSRLLCCVGSGSNVTTA